MTHQLRERGARLRSVSVRNYKSLENVCVDLESLTVFVGPNGVGKSNFIDALAFVQECLATSVELAFKNRGGVGAVPFRSAARLRSVGFDLELDLPGGSEANYAFEIVPQAEGQFRISREWCEVREFMGRSPAFRVEDGVFKQPIEGIQAQIPADRLALYAASFNDTYRPVYDFLTGMRFYSIRPDKLREFQDADPGESLKRDGSNAAAVLKRLRGPKHSEAYERLCALLSGVVDGVRKVEYKPVGQKETVQFKQDVGEKRDRTFSALNMSDGTLRVLGLLLAVYQSKEPTVLAIEEPESTVHPAAAELILEVLADAATRYQVLLTTHSPDLIDSKALDDSQIRVVAMEKGKTLIGPLAEHSREAIRQRLYTPGELLRVDELDVDKDAAADRAEGGGRPAS